MTLTRLDLVRHGHTVWHDSGGVAGRSDIALSDTGRQAVRALAAGLGHEWRVNAWYCSPLQRARETSMLLRAWLASTHAAADLQLPDVEFDERLVELDFGDWEGLTWSQVHEQYESAMREWGQDWINQAPPNGETFAAQVQRCGDWLSDVQAVLSDDREQSAVAVLHGGSIRALLCSCLDWPLTRAMDFRVDPASICRLQHHPGEGWLLRVLNSHYA